MNQKELLEEQKKNKNKEYSQQSNITKKCVQIHWIEKKRRKRKNREKKSFQFKCALLFS